MGGTGSGSSIEWRSRNEVLDGYDLHCQKRDKVYYSVWQGSTPKFVYDDGDHTEGRDLLDQNLAAWEQSGTSAGYSLRFHPALDKNGNITNSTPYNGSGNFILNERTGVMGRVSGPASDPRLDKILELLVNQEERLKDLEQEELAGEIQEADPDEVDNIIGKVHRIETAINQSPLLGDLYKDLRFGLRMLSRKLGIEVPEVTHNQVNGNTMNNTTQQQQGTQQQLTPEIIRELCAPGNFPELPGMLLGLYNMMLTNREDFEYIKRKLISGLNQAL